MEKDVTEILSFFDYTYPRVCDLYINGILSAEDIKELRGIYWKTKSLAFGGIVRTASEEHFMQDVRDWFLKHTPYGGGRLFLYEPFDWLMLYSGNDKVINVRKKVAEGLELPSIDYTVLSHADVELNTMNGFDELGRYFLECALNGFYEPIDFALNFAQKNRHVYQERTLLSMLYKHFLKGEDIVNLEYDFVTRQEYRERVKECVARLSSEKVVHAGDMWLVCLWYGDTEVIFWEKEKDEVVVSLALQDDCGKLLNAGKYKQLKRMITPMAVGDFVAQHSEMAKETFKLLESKFALLNSTMKMVVMLHEL